jgi:hypothetical protein
VTDQRIETKAEQLEMDAAACHTAASPETTPATGSRRGRLARPLELERVWTPDTQAMVAALRVVLDLPRQLPDRGQGGVR